MRFKNITKHYLNRVFFFPTFILIPFYGKISVYSGTGYNGLAIDPTVQNPLNPLFQNELVSAIEFHNKNPFKECQAIFDSPKKRYSYLLIPDLISLTITGNGYAALRLTILNRFNNS